ncbi:MAG TPA: hypothetical protein VEW93_15570 [Acidimicrobiales bacterium]|nr:hypothetical protein [Acidimicrobiales bacterium]
MAAVIVPITFVPGTVVPAARPALRLIEGGRSAPARAVVYRRRRVVAALALVTVLALALLAARSVAGVAAGWAAPTPAAVGGPVVVVEAGSGDTLWTLARQVHPTGDVRPVVEAMVADRGTPALQVGDEVRVPAEG